MNRMSGMVFGVVAVGCFALTTVHGAELSVGPAGDYERIEQALTAARAGDTILVYPKPDNRPYENVALAVNQPRITIRAAVQSSSLRIPLRGQGFDYSGRGQIPRAIIQVNRDADDCVLEGFDLSGAHNESHNGAGIRINQANRATVRACAIYGNDMGVMSNGDGTTNAAVGQLFSGCLIHSNGDPSDPGYNHNLYLGGTSATLQGCEVHSSLTGHNVKSRCHRTAILGCYIHDSANRELDLVDAADTAPPGSDAVLAGNLIVKAAACQGNHQVIHFGKDGGKEHNGVLYLVHNTLSTPFGGSVIHLSAAGVRVTAVNNITWDAGSGRAGLQFVQAAKGIDLSRTVTGRGNWFAAGFSGQALDVLSLQKSVVAPLRQEQIFMAPLKGDFRPVRSTPGLASAGTTLGGDLLAIIGGKLLQYKAPQQTAERRLTETLFPGACE